VPGWLTRELKPVGGRGTDLCTGPAENPPRAPFDSGVLPMVGRGTLRAICVLPIAGRCTLLVGGLGTPRRVGDGTGPDALSGPCGMIRDGVKGEDPVRPADGFWPLMPPIGVPAARPKPPEGDVRETTGRIPDRAGGMDAG